MPRTAKPLPEVPPTVDPSEALVPLPPARWANRIVAYGEEDPAQLLAHPNNVRIHPAFQQELVEASLDELGWIQDVVVNRQTGCVVDGHLRVSLALRREEARIPVKYVDLTPAQEKLALALLDKSAGYAVIDGEKLDALLREIHPTDETILAALADLAKDAGLYPDGPAPEPPPLLDPGDPADAEEFWPLIKFLVPKPVHAAWLAAKKARDCEEHTLLSSLLEEAGLL